MGGGGRQKLFWQTGASVSGPACRQSLDKECSDATEWTSCFPDPMETEQRRRVPVPLARPQSHKLFCGDPFWRDGEHRIGRNIEKQKYIKIRLEK